MNIAHGVLATAFLMFGVTQALADDAKSQTHAELPKTVVEDGWISTTGSVISENDESFTIAPHDRPNTALKIDHFGMANPQVVSPGDQVTVVGEIAEPGEEADVAGVLMTNISNRASGIDQNATGSGQ